MTPFEAEVLKRVGDDYEAPHTIANDIGRALKRAVTEAQVRDALFSLVRSGHVQAYKYDLGKRDYVPISASAASSRRFSVRSLRACLGPVTARRMMGIEAIPETESDSDSYLSLGRLSRKKSIAEGIEGSKDWPLGSLGTRLP